jgi:hypothetical protein
MDWKDLGPVLGSSAPLLGKLISVGVSFIPGIGPIVGPIIGPAIGGIIARQFGVPPTPEAVAQAVANNPDDLVKAKLAAATEETKAQYKWAEAVETGQIRLDETSVTQINESLRAELLVESPFKTWWRPTNGWVLAIENAMLGACLIGCLVLAMAGNPAPLQIMQDAWPVILCVIGVPAIVVGVNVFTRGQEKMKAMEVTQTAPPPGKPVPLAKPVPPTQVTAQKISAAVTRPSPGPVGPLVGRQE